MATLTPVHLLMCRVCLSQLFDVASDMKAFIFVWFFVLGLRMSRTMHDGEAGGLSFVRHSKPATGWDTYTFPFTGMKVRQPTLLCSSSLESHE